MEVGEGTEGFCDHCSSPRGWFGVELGPSLNWPQMVGFGGFVNSEVADIPVMTGLSKCSIDGQSDALNLPFFDLRARL